MRYRVTGSVTISVSVVIEAKSPAEARELARQAPMQSLCGQCAGGDDECWSTGGELDGLVSIARGGVEEA
jgi:hypothetical protein